MFNRHSQLVVLSSVIILDGLLFRASGHDVVVEFAPLKFSQISSLFRVKKKNRIQSPNIYFSVAFWIDKNYVMAAMIIATMHQDRVQCVIRRCGFGILQIWIQTYFLVKFESTQVRKNKSKNPIVESNAATINLSRPFTCR